MCVSELKGKALPAHKTVLCIFYAETKTAKNIRKARSPLDSYGFSYIPRESGAGRTSETVSRTGYKVDLNYSKNAIVICKMCSELRRNARQGKGRHHEDKRRRRGNSSCDSRRKIMFYLWVAQLPMLLMLLFLCFHPALLFYPFAVRSLCWAQLKIGLNDNSQFAIFCKFSTAECIIYAADIADFS